jgi:hypothetical protein
MHGGPKCGVNGGGIVGKELHGVSIAPALCVKVANQRRKAYPDAMDAITITRHTTPTGARSAPRWRGTMPPRA